MEKRLLLDANLAILVAVGLTDRAFIGRHKRLATYDEADFDIVSGMIGRSSGILFTPNVLSETSNLARYVSDPMRSQICVILAEIIARSEECYISSSDAAKHPAYLRLGLTDAALLVAAEQNATLLTDDLNLYLAAESAGLSPINYNHLRELRGDFRN